MKLIQLNCLCIIFIFCLSSLYGGDLKNGNKDTEKGKNEVKEYYADNMLISSRKTTLYIVIEKKDDSSKKSPKKKGIDNFALDDFQFHSLEERGVFRRYNAHATIFLNGFYIQNNLEYALFYMHLKQGGNQILFDFSKSPFISKLQNGDTITVAFAKQIYIPKNIYKKHTFTYQKGRNKYLWTFEIKRLTLKPQWINAKLFNKLSDTNRNEISMLTNKLISLYKNEDLSTLSPFIDSLSHCVYLDSGKLKGKDPMQLFFRNCEFFYKNAFCGKNRRNFKSTKSFSITLNESNKKVVNVLSTDNNPIYQVESTGHLINNPDGTPQYISIGQDALNFIYINGKWQIY